MIRLLDIEAARQRIAGRIRTTLAAPAYAVSEAIGAPVVLKLENKQRTGSFKERGALNRLLSLDESERQRGVITASAGNHAQGVAYHARELGIDATIVMPFGTPLVKVERTRSYGAEVILSGENYDAAFDHAERLKEERGRVYVHAYDDERIVAGQGTIGLEILEQVPDVETIVVPVGGGGLISGIALAVKSRAPRCRVVGVEPSVIASMKRALEVGGPVTLDAHRTLADGIAVRRVGELNYALCRSYVDEIVTVDDNAIAGAVLYLLENEKVVAEGAGAAPVAALLGGQVKGAGRGTVVAVVSGGNIDVNLIERIIERGLVESGRLARVCLSVPDRPGALADVLERIAEQGANVLKVHHERTFTLASLSLVTVEVVVETRGSEHVAALLRALEDAGYRVEA